MLPSLWVRGAVPARSVSPSLHVIGDQLDGRDLKKINYRDRGVFFCCD